MLPPSSVDLMVTSPPYMNNYHYVRNTRPQLFWLSLVSSPKELRRLEEANFGKYWQTVRGAEPVDLNFDHPQLAEIPCRASRDAHGAGAIRGAWVGQLCHSLLQRLRSLLSCLKAHLGATRCGSGRDREFHHSGTRSQDGPDPCSYCPSTRIRAVRECRRSVPNAWVPASRPSAVRRGDQRSGDPI